VHRLVGPGGAGLLDGVDATTHWLELETLGALGANPTSGRVVELVRSVVAAMETPS
jgi:hypothetical protein